MHAAFASIDFVTLTLFYILMKFEAETQQKINTNTNNL